MGIAGSLPAQEINLIPYRAPQTVDSSHTPSPTTAPSAPRQLFILRPQQHFHHSHHSNLLVHRFQKLPTIPRQLRASLQRHSLVAQFAAIAARSPAVGRSGTFPRFGFLLGSVSTLTARLASRSCVRFTVRDGCIGGCNPVTVCTVSVVSRSTALRPRFRNSRLR